MLCSGVQLISAWVTLVVLLSSAELPCVSTFAESFQG